MDKDLHALGPARGLDLDATLSSGQCFRWQQTPAGWQGIAAGRAVTVRIENGLLLARCPAADDPFWQNYFALDLDYTAILARFAKSRRLAACVAAAPGLRVLRQPFFEVLCTFLISQNNNIPRIRGIVDRLCAVRRTAAGRAAGLPHPGGAGCPDPGKHGGAAGRLAERLSFGCRPGGSFR